MAAQAQRFETGSGREAGAELLQSVEDIFGSLLKAAWLSGSFAYEGARAGRSDIDVVIVLDAPVPADADTLRLIRRFVDSYLTIHARHGFDPDLDFPGEFVTPSMIDQTLGWRGLAWEGAPVLAFPTVKPPDYWLGRPDRWYNAWLSMTAFSRFPVGDRDYHSSVKLAAWKTVCRFLLLRADRRQLNSDEMLLGVDQFGVKPRYPGFWSAERDSIDCALGELKAEGNVQIEAGQIVPEMRRLREWERQLAETIRRSVDPPPLLLDLDRHRDIETYAARRWTDLAAAIR